MATPILSVVLVPCTWNLPVIQSSIETPLREAGYTDTVTVNLPSPDGDPPHSSRDQDIAAIRSAVELRITAGNHVIVEAHSYGGAPASDAMEGVPSKRTSNIAEGQNKVSEGCVISITQPPSFPTSVPVFRAKHGRRNQRLGSASTGITYCDGDLTNPPSSILHIGAETLCAVERRISEYVFDI